MDSVKRILLPILTLLLLTGCQINYLLKSAYSQLELLRQRVPLEETLQDPNLNQADKQKLLLAKKARDFAIHELNLKPSDNYTSFVRLNRPYVSYVVSAAPKWKLEHHQWWYPVVGKMPYKGFFNRLDANEEQMNLQKEDLDTYLRGVTAYSTLGWFNDPILSSMLNYKDHDLVNTVIHETVHATLYIKNSADFNERLAVFLGNKGMEQFYLKTEGEASPTLAQVRMENADDRLFSVFIGPKLKQLKQWYEQLPANERNESLRQKQFKEIQNDFTQNILPQMKTDTYKKFADLELNNARLLVYKTYLQDLADFEKLYTKVDNDFARFIELCRQLEASRAPEQDLKSLL